MTDNIDFSVTAKEITTGGKENAYSSVFGCVISTDASFTSSGEILYFYTGEECKPRVEVKMNGSVLTTGYSVEYANKPPEHRRLAQLQRWKGLI